MRLAQPACLGSFYHTGGATPTCPSIRKPWPHTDNHCCQVNIYRGKYIFSKARHVLENHNGNGVKTLKLNLSICSKEDIDTGLVHGWLQSFVKPGITELGLLLPRCYALEYNFPYSLLSWDEEFGATIQSLHLASCGFHPTEGPSPTLLGFSRSLSKVSLHNVGITEDELGLFLSSCFDLERLDLSNCNMIASLKIPRVLHKLRIVRIHACRALKTVVSNAPNLSTINYDEGPPLLSFSLGDRLETKKLLMHSMCLEDMIGYADSDLPCIAPNLETLVLSTFCEKINARRMTAKFQHLKRLVICLGKGAKFSEGHNFFSLACFLHACAVLETFTLRIAFNYSWNEKYHISWQTKEETSQFCHGGLQRLRMVTITGFCSAQSLAELTCHILSYAASSLQCIHLDTTPGYETKHSSTDRCWKMHAEALRESKRALSNVRQYIEPKVPHGVELKQMKQMAAPRPALRIILTRLLLLLPREQQLTPPTFQSKTIRVLENHNGNGVKTLKLNLSICSKEDIDTNLLDNWLQAFVKPGITELGLLLPKCCAHEYNFPYLLLSWDEKYPGYQNYHIDRQSWAEMNQFYHGGLGRLRTVTITGFCSAKGLAELTRHILRSAASSLQCISLDTTPGYDRKHSSTDRCQNMCMGALRESERALSNVRQYVEPEVPHGVELKVLGPCRQCHYIDAKAMEEAQRASWLSAQRAPWRSTRRGRIMFIS
nr:unnamed protein product [Digitaria exilis]